MRDGLKPWLIIYELVYLLTLAIAGHTAYGRGWSSPIWSMDYLIDHDTIYLLLSILLDNLSSFYLGSIFILLHPSIGILPVIVLSSSEGKILASWLRGSFSTVHLISNLLEDQAYIFLWTLVASLYSEYRGSGDLVVKWSLILRRLRRLIVLSFILFLSLACLEVCGVIWIA